MRERAGGGRVDLLETALIADGACPVRVWLVTNLRSAVRLQASPHERQLRWLRGSAQLDDD